jgi:biotin carboxylase
VAQCKVDCVEQAAAWLDLHNQYPVVVKPAASAGSDNVNFCYNRGEVLTAVGKVLGEQNTFGFANSHALVQEYLDGQEWVVDTVSSGDDCVVTNVTKYWKVRTAADKLVYRHSAFHAPDMAEHGALIDYAKGVVRALGLKHGAAHIELIETARGPVLVEVNGRMHGGDAVYKLKPYATFTQLGLLVDAHIDAAEFKRKAQHAPSYSKHIIAHFLISGMAGQVSKVIEQSQLDEIGSYVEHRMPKVGDKVKVTDSLVSAPGYLWLMNESLQALNDDQASLIDMEERGLLYA